MGVGYLSILSFSEWKKMKPEFLVIFEGVMYCYRLLHHWTTRLYYYYSVQYYINITRCCTRTAL